MTARLRTSHILLAGLGSALAATVACGEPDAAVSADAQKTTQASSVIIDIKAANGDFMGSCSGTLIGPKMVLTAGHCVAGGSSWSVTSSAGKATGKVASTPWKHFGSSLSHPEHSDIGLILLDSPIKLDSYPQLATKAVKDGAKGVRFHRDSDSAKDVGTSAAVLKDGTAKGFKLNYLLDAPKGERFVDTGGAVLSNDGKIVGVVSGKGKTSNQLHVARVDGFAAWTKTAVACSNALKTATWGGGNDDNGGGGYGGTPSGGGGDTGSWGGGGGSWGGGGGGWGGGGWGGGGGGWGSSSGGYGGGGGTTTGGKGTTNPGSTVPGSSGTPGGGTTTGTTSGGTSTSGQPGNPGDATNGGKGGDDDDDATATPNTCPGIPACVGADCGDGSNGLGGGTGAAPSDGDKAGSSTSGSPGSSGATGNNGGADDDDDTTTSSSSSSGTTTSSSSSGGTVPGTTTSSSSSGNVPGTTSSSGGSSSGGPGSDTEHCEGSGDNTETCPSAPDSASCSGPSCGGCGANKSCVDNNIDYGGCSACTVSGGATTVPK